MALAMDYKIFTIQLNVKKESYPSFEEINIEASPLFENEIQALVSSFPGHWHKKGYLILSQIYFLYEIPLHKKGEKNKTL